MLTRQNVGDLTLLGMPRPSAIPFARIVFPVPSSPTSPMSQPALSPRPHSWPTSSVSSELLEMSVAMQIQRANSRLISERDAARRRDFADARERQIRKLGVPGIEERNR